MKWRKKLSKNVGKVTIYTMLTCFTEKEFLLYLFAWLAHRLGLCLTF